MAKAVECLYFHVHVHVYMTSDLLVSVCLVLHVLCYSSHNTKHCRTGIQPWVTDREQYMTDLWVQGKR